MVLGLFYGTVAASAGNVAQEEALLPAHYIRFLFGVVMLQHAPELSTSVRAQRYQELQRITGITPQQFGAWTLSFKGRPEQWKKIQDSVIQIIDKEEKLWQTSMSANSTTKTSKPKP